MIIYLGLRLPSGSMQPTLISDGAGSTSIYIWPCSGRGLPCGFDYSQPGALLPRLFTLTPHTTKVPKVIISLRSQLYAGSLPVFVGKSCSIGFALPEARLVIYKRSDTTITPKNAGGILMLQVLMRKQKDDTTEF